MARITWVYVQFYAESKGYVAEKIRGHYEITNNQTGTTGVYETVLEAYAAVFNKEI